MKYVSIVDQAKEQESTEEWSHLGDHPWQEQGCVFVCLSGVELHYHTHPGVGDQSIDGYIHYHLEGREGPRGGEGME